MDSQIWHDFCTRPACPEPNPLTLAQWERLSGAARADHTAQLRQWLRQIYLQTGELAGIAQVISDVVDANSESPSGAKDIAVVTGKNAVGKSTLIKGWARQRYNDWTAHAARDARGRPIWNPDVKTEADLCPVVWINLHSSARIKEFDSQILEFFGLPGEGVIRNLSNRVVRAAERHRVRVLVIDDAHLLKTNWKGGRDVLDHVKHINTELGEIGATLVLVGANLEGGDLVEDPQIAGRLKLIAFPQYEIDGLEEQRAWQRIVRDIEELLLPHLPGGRPGMLFTELAGELWFRTQGYLGDLTKLLCEATLAAINDRTHAIRAEHLETVILSSRAETEYRKPPRQARTAQ